MKSLVQTLGFAAVVPALIVGFALLIGMSNGASPAEIFPPASLPAIGGIFTVWFGLFLLQWAYEFRGWNNGVCRANGLSWKLDWTDSGNGAKYSAGDHSLMVNNWFIGR